MVAMGFQPLACWLLKNKGRGRVNLKTLFSPLSQVPYTYLAKLNSPLAGAPSLPDLLLKKNTDEERQPVLDTPLTWAIEAHRCSRLPCPISKLRIEI